LPKADHFAFDNIRFLWSKTMCDKISPYSNWPLEKYNANGGAQRSTEIKRAAPFDVLRFTKTPGARRSFGILLKTDHFQFDTIHFVQPERLYDNIPPYSNMTIGKSDACIS
jgi:hypothetical protein